MIHRAYFGYDYSYNRQKVLEAEFISQHSQPKLDIRESVTTNLGNMVEIIIRPYYSSIEQVQNYPYDKKENVFVVIKGSKQPKIARETFTWDTKEWHKNNYNNIRNKFNTELKDWNDRKYQYVVDSNLEEIKTVLPDYEDYLEMTPDTAKEALLAKGWTLPNNIDFTRFTPGSWLDHPTPGYRCSAGVNNDMDFQTKTITQYGWSSDD
jgi:hypothetical protein